MKLKKLYKFISKDVNAKTQVIKIIFQIFRVPNLLFLKEIKIKLDS